eukprot:759598-Hanusia_phi.AAC.2
MSRAGRRLIQRGEYMPRGEATCEQEKSVAGIARREQEQTGSTEQLGQNQLAVDLELAMVLRAGHSLRLAGEVEGRGLALLCKGLAL